MAAYTPSQGRPMRTNAQNVHLYIKAACRISSCGSDMQEREELRQEAERRSELEPC